MWEQCLGCPVRMQDDRRSFCLRAGLRGAAEDFVGISLFRVWPGGFLQANIRRPTNSQGW
jgi:hypothetical protein